MKSILGTEDIKANIHAAFSWEIPSTRYREMQLEPILQMPIWFGETEFAIEWVWTELFHEYSHAESPGKTTRNKNATTTEELRSILKQISQKHWYGFDAVLIPSETIRNEIVHDTAQFDTESFWKSFFFRIQKIFLLWEIYQRSPNTNRKDITQSMA